MTPDGELLFDSGDEFERILQRVDRANFNSTNDENDTRKNRSDDKGPEPEAIRTVIYEGRFYAMIGLERQGGIMIYDISDPVNAKFVNYVTNRDFSVDAESENAGDLGIEDILWIRESESPNGKALIATANEVSSTVTIYEIVPGEFTPPTANIFEEEINITDYAPNEVVMPPSPLTSEIIFVGGHDIVQTTATYGNPAGRAIAKEWHDFIGFTPDESGESLGWVSVNHERIFRDDRIGDGGGMTTFRIKKNGSDAIEVMNQELEDGRTGEFFNVDFVNTVGETGMNCAGISAPNGRIWTAEEWYRTSQSSINRDDTGVRDTSDFTIDAPEFPEVDGMTIKKYENFNYMVEIDPKQAMAIRKQYNWGRGGWEGGAITADGNTVYLGMDATPAPWVKYEADTPWDFNNGTLYVYKEDADEKWIPVPATAENMLGGLSDYAWSVGATMFNRNEWVTIDQRTGIVYWTETGRDNPGSRWADEAAEGGTYARHHQLRAIDQGVASPGDSDYWDYFGRVLYYDPATNYVGVTIEGGPYLEASPSIADYPSKHLSNPDGLNVLNVGNKSYLMIQEDLNGTSFGRTPEGVSNRLCELYLLDTETTDAVIDDLVRITAVPAGAEITGAIQIDNNTILVNSQHPRTDNPFPFNHSLTMAIHGFENLDSADLQGTTMSSNLKMNTISREIELGQNQDFAIYDNEGKRMKVFRNKAIADVGDFDEGTYYLKTESDLFKITID